MWKNETMIYLGEEWTERQRNEGKTCKCDTLSLKRINVSLSQKGL